MYQKGLNSVDWWRVLLHSTFLETSPLLARMCRCIGEILDNTDENILHLIYGFIACQTDLDVYIIVCAACARLNW